MGQTRVAGTRIQGGVIPLSLRVEEGPRQNLGSAWKMGMEAAEAQKTLPATHTVPHVPEPSTATCHKGWTMTTRLPPEPPAAAEVIARGLWVVLVRAGCLGSSWRSTAHGGASPLLNLGLPPIPLVGTPLTCPGVPTDSPVIRCSPITA